MRTKRQQPRYHAFISYAHEDEPGVRWLHRLLTRYWVPGHGRRRIFLDSSSLSAGWLNRTIGQALADSQYLVVCCSRHAAESPWVDTEVETFLEHPS